MDKYCCLEFKHHVEKKDIKWHGRIEHDVGAFLPNWAIYKKCSHMTQSETVSHETEVIFDIDYCPFCGAELENKNE